MRFLSAFLALALACPTGLHAVVSVSVNIPMAGAPLSGAQAGSAAFGARTPANPDFTLDAPRLDTLFQTASQELVRTLDGIAAIPTGQRTFQNSVLAIDNAYAKCSEAMAPVHFLGAVSPDENIRGAADSIRARFSDLMVDQSMREDLYRAVRSYADQGEALQGEDARLLAMMLRDYRKSGMELPAIERSRYMAIEKRLSELAQAFDKNLREWDDGLAVRPEELGGVPKAVVDGLEKLPDGRLRVSVEPTVYSQVMRKADSARLRMRLYYRREKTAAKANLPIMQEALKLRHESARLLGYKNYAEKALDGRMAKAPKRVWDLLLRLKKLLRPSADAESAEVLARKRQEVPGAAKLQPWDMGYYGSKLSEEALGFDPEEVRAYFPVEKIVPETLRIYEELLGLRFVKLDVPVWDADVQAYEIHDAKTGERIGRFYLDLFPRKGKRGGAAAYSLIQYRELSDGTFREPVSAVVANFTRPAPGQPALLRHGEVKTLFHELGHVMHQTLSTTKRWSFSGSSTAQDFVETPSQMMENFIWQPQVIQRLSGHYQDPSKTLPQALMDKLLAARNYHSASETLGQAAMAAMDLAYHSAVPKDILAVYRKVMESFTGESVDRASTFPLRFSHIIRGYAAGYYSYLWSRVFAQDVFSAFAAAGVMSPAVGARYRRAILERGSSVDEDILLRDFLGRDPDEKAFLRWLGIDPGRPQS